MQKLWFSIYDFSFNYPGAEPPFADPQQFDFATELAANTDKIKAELQDYLKAHELDSYFNTSMVSKKNSWIVS